MRTYLLAAAAATLLAGPVLADPPAWAPANGYHQAQYQDNHDGDHRDGDHRDGDRRDGDHRDGDRRGNDNRGYGNQGYGNQGYNSQRGGQYSGGNWYPDDHYRRGNYRARYIGPNDQIYRGRDNRYYCRRSDGTAGLIIGGIGGGVLGDALAPGGSRTLGALLGGGLGAVLGNSIDRNRVQCR